MTFREAVLEALRAALGEDADGLGDLAGMLTAPPRTEMGDLAFPCFPLAKVRRMAPPKIAADLAARIPAGGPIAQVVAEGPYVNFFADPAALLEGLARSLADGSFAASLRTAEPRRVMVEFSQPNTHKVFHVGHLRNVALGDCLVRVLRARGHDVVAANYYGDFGIDVAKCLWWMSREARDATPETGRTAWLGAFYSAANQALKVPEDASEDVRAEKAAWAAEVREVLRAMEEGQEPIAGTFRETRQWCLDEFAAVYAWLGVRFDHDFFESQLEEAGRKVVDDFLAKGTFVESRGAIICDLEAEKLPPALVRKSDGSSLYLTWDLALAREKFERFGIERSLYVVATEQNLHFQQLFATLGHMGYEHAKDCRHVAYELVMLPEGKMSSRKGTATPFHELRTRVLAAIEEKMREEERTERGAWSDEDWQETLRRVAVACLKYGMLHVGNTRSVVFELDAWTNPEGDTGAYLLYSLARISGIFRKAGAETDVDLASGLEGVGEFGNEAERGLLNHLLQYPDVVARVARTCDPSALANYVFEGAKRFSRFYQACPVLQAEADLRRARLVLIKATETIFRQGLELLGIEPVEAM